MSTAKQRILKLVEEMPDDASSDEIRYRIYVRERVEQGKEDVRNGRLLDPEEVDRRLSRFQA